MNCTNFMIGDLVSAEVTYYDDEDNEIVETHPLRIDAISENNNIAIDADMFCFSGNFVDGYESDSFGDIEPIPLTEEILMANGFEKRSDSTFYLGEIFKFHVVVWIFDKEEVVIEVENDLEKRGVNKAHVCENGYVHILQHALRLCGLKEIADNFKIE